MVVKYYFVFEKKFEVGVGGEIMLLIWEQKKKPWDNTK